MKTNKNNININIANLKKSNVLIFSNTYIVGLKYDKEITSAPIVTYLSKKIKETEKFAQDLSISIIKNNIADKIVSILDIGDEIPVSLYLPIAQIYASILTKNEIEFSELLNDEVFDSNFASGLCIEFAPDLYKKMMKLAITTKLEKLRKKIIADLGLVIIPIKINKNLSLAQGKYFIKLNRDILLESDLSDSITNFSTIVINDLKCVISENAGKLLSRRQVLAILEKLNSKEKGYSYQILQEISIARIQTVLSGLLEEQIPITQIEIILDTLCLYNDVSVSVDYLIEKVRIALSKTICEKFLSKDKNLQIIRLSENIEEKFPYILDGNNKHFSKQFIENLFCAITEKNKNAIEMGYECPIILCSSAIRRHLKNLIKNNFSNHVMSYKEIDKHYKVKEIAVISEINI